MKNQRIAILFISLTMAFLAYPLAAVADDITGRVELGEDWAPLIADSRAKVEDLVNEFFKAKLLGIPEVQEFLNSLEG